MLSDIYLFKQNATADHENVLKEELSNKSNDNRRTAYSFKWLRFSATIVIH